MSASLFTIPILALPPSTDEEGGNQAKDADAREAGVVTTHSRGLHGYVGYSASRPAARADYGAGIGFYSAVWPLIDEPIAHFQIGLPSAWITPDNPSHAPLLPASHRQLCAPTLHLASVAPPATVSCADPQPRSWPRPGPPFLQCIGDAPLCTT